MDNESVRLMVIVAWKATHLYHFQVLSAPVLFERIKIFSDMNIGKGRLINKALDAANNTIFPF